MIMLSNIPSGASGVRMRGAHGLDIKLVSHTRDVREQTLVWTY